MTSDLSTLDPRQIPRARTLLKARVISDDGSRIIDCLVRNLSPLGAKLDVDPASLPAEFTLEIPQKHRSFRARLIWCGAGTAGVRFCETPADRDESTAQRIEAVSIENEKLRQTIAILEQRLVKAGQDLTDHSA